MKPVLIGPLTLIVMGVLPGCGGPAPPVVSPARPAQPPAAVADRPDADRLGDESAADVASLESEPAHAARTSSDERGVAATLQQLGAALKTDQDGQIVEVSFRGVRVGDEALTYLTKLPRVKSVLLADTAITSAGLPALGAIPSLRVLDLRGCAIDNAGLESLRPLTQLQVLRLSGKNSATQVDDQGLVALAALPHLKALLLDYLPVTSAGLARLGPLHDLEELCLAQTSLDDAGMRTIKQFPRLKKLRLSGTTITDAGLAHLADLPALEELDVSECGQLTDEAMLHVGRLGTLRDLNLWRVGITDQGVRHLAGLTALERLNLDNTRLTDAGLPFLASLTRLTFLHLGSTAVSDAGLVHLEGLRALKDLKVTRTAVTAAGVAALEQKLPDTAIQLEYVPGQ